jgi:hypothetical protein
VLNHRAMMPMMMAITPFRRMRCAWTQQAARLPQLELSNLKVECIIVR